MSKLPSKSQVLELLSLIREHGLVAGQGQPVPGQMCIEAAWCYVLKRPHSDDPGCVGTEVRKLKMGLNDRAWSSPQARAKGLERFAIAQLGSDELNQKEFRDRFWFLCGTRLQPLVWRFLATKENEKARLELADNMEKSKDLAECKAHAHAHAHAYAYTYTYAYDYDYTYAYTYAHDYTYAYAYAYAYDYAYDYDYGRDTWFTKVADLAVELLIDMKSPGCKFLSLL